MAALLGSRRFLPLFITQMLGAVNDNLFKNAIVVLILFRGSSNALLVPLAGGIFILPYALFSAMAGQLADRMEKSLLVRITKLYELGLMVLAAIGFLGGSEAFLLLVLFGLGVQATFFGPVKYGILPELLRPESLVQGNGLIEASTFIGILLGTVLGGVLILAPHGRLLVSVAVLLVAGAGVLSARAVPNVAAAAPGLRIGRNFLVETGRLIGEARARPVVWIAILALSWFWMVGATFLAEFPVLVKQDFGGNGQMVTLMLAVFSVGVGAGSVLAVGLLRSQISAWPVAPAAVLLSLFALDFAWSAGHVTPADGWRDMGSMLNHRGGWRVLGDLFAVSVCGGVFSVPLYAVLQGASEADWRARMISANNVMNAAFMVAGAGLLAGGAAAGLSPGSLLAIVGLGTLAVAAAIWRSRLR